MAMRPLLLHLRRRPSRHFALLALLLVGVAAWYVTAHGGWVNVLHLPPVLDASTPRTQNGFTLEDIKIPGNDYGPVGDDRQDAAILLIRPPAFPHLAVQYQTSDGTFYYGSSFGSRTPQLQASAQSSNGDVTPLNWTIIGTQAEPQFYRVEIPGGYSNECRYITVTLVPNVGPFPRWRIKRLPNMRHAIPDPSRVTDSVTANAITTTARAWRSRHQIFTQIRPVLPPNSHQWELATNDQWSEWERFDRPRPNGASTGPPILGRGGVFTRQDTAYVGGQTARFPAPYRSASRAVRVDCELRQFETCDEQVTFHNLPVKEDTHDSGDETFKSYALVLPHPTTLTTPSGIVVTLPVQGQVPSLSRAVGINLELSVRSTAAPSDLPNSSLARQFGRPIAISIRFKPPHEAESWTVKPGDTQMYTLGRPRNPAWHPMPKGMAQIPFYLDVPPVLKNFTVIVRQRVDLQTIPMTFTVPVSDTPPPDVH